MKDIILMSPEELYSFIRENFSWELADRLEHKELYEAILLLMQDIVERRKK